MSSVLRLLFQIFVLAVRSLFGALGELVAGLLLDVGSAE
jgi:hypothetical protein